MLRGSVPKISVSSRSVTPSLSPSALKVGRGGFGAQSASQASVVSPVSHWPLPQTVAGGSGGFCAQSASQASVVSPVSHWPLPQTVAGGTVTQSAAQVTAVSGDSQVLSPQTGPVATGGSTTGGGSGSGA